MTQPTAELLQAIKGLAEKATKGPWAYRPDEYDDWGIVKSPPFRPEGFDYDLRCVLARFRDPDALDDEILSRHRKAKTDPWAANAELVVTLRNNLPTIISALELKERVEKAGGYMLVNGNPLMPQSWGVSASDRGPMR